MSYLIDLIHRSNNGLRLTPRERAFLKAAQGAIIGFIVDAFPQIFNVLQGRATFNISSELVASLIGAALLWALKMWSTQNPDDAAIGVIAEKYLQAKKQATLDNLTIPAEHVVDGSLVIPAIQFTVPVNHTLLDHVQYTPTTQTIIPVQSDVRMQVAKAETAKTQSVTLSDPHATQAVPVAAPPPAQPTGVISFPTDNSSTFGAASIPSVLTANVTMPPPSNLSTYGAAASPSQQAVDTGAPAPSFAEAPTQQFPVPQNVLQPPGAR